MSVSLTTTRAAAAGHLAAVVAVALATVLAGGPRIWTGAVAFGGPLAVAVALRGADGFVRAHTAAALRFNVSIAIYLVAIVAAARLLTGSPYTVQLVPFLLFCNLLIAFNWLIFTAIAIQRGATGQTFTYPMTLRAIARPGD
jgi:uncharacterized Tic20 family protein